MMKLGRWTVATIAVATVLIGTVSSQAEKAEPVVVPTESGEIGSTDQAHEVALAITGFATRLRGSQDSGFEAAGLVTLDREDTLFLSAWPSGGQAWRVVFDSVDIRTPLAMEWNLVWPLRRFEVLLDPESGTLLRIMALPETEGRAEDDTVSVNYLESHNHGRNTGEKYVGPIRGDSVVPFVAALNAAVACAPKDASAIAAILVAYRSRAGNSIDAWVINTFGSTAGMSPIGDPAAPPCCLWNRCIVDARTGQWLSWWTGY